MVTEQNVRLEVLDSERLTKAEVQALLRLSRKTLERRMKSRQIGYQKDGRLVFFTTADIENYKSSRMVRACGVAAR